MPFGEEGGAGEWAVFSVGEESGVGVLDGKFDVDCGVEGDGGPGFGGAGVWAESGLERRKG